MGMFFACDKYPYNEGIFENAKKIIYKIILLFIYKYISTNHLNKKYTILKFIDKIL